MNARTESGKRIACGYWAIIWTGFAAFAYALYPIHIGFIFLALFFAVFAYVMFPIQDIKKGNNNAWGLSLMFLNLGYQAFILRIDLTFGLIAGLCAIIAGVNALFYWFGIFNSSDQI